MRYYIINHCNQWHSYDSFRLIGIVDESKLESSLRKIKKELGYDDDCMEKYVDVNEVVLNDLDI